MRARNLAVFMESFRFLLRLVLLAGVGSCLAQTLPPIRGAYTPGFNATNAGVMPEPGLTYANYFMHYSFNSFQTGRGDTILEKGDAAVFVDVNLFVFVTKKKVLGANYAMVAGLPISNSSITSVTLGAVGGGGGFDDSFYQPFSLGWHLKRADIQAAYAF